MAALPGRVQARDRQIQALQGRLLGGLLGRLTPILLVVLRLIQGFSVGGELAGSTTYIAESAPPRQARVFRLLLWPHGYRGLLRGRRRGRCDSGVDDAGAAGVLGWRIPFLISLPLALFGLWARLRLGETREFEAMVERREVEQSPLLKVFKEHRSAVVKLFCILAGNSGLSYIGQTYLSIYLIGDRGFDKRTVYWAAAAAIALGCCMYPLAGMLVDRFGRKPLLIAGYGAFVIIAWPVFIVLSATTSILVAGVILFAYTVLVAIYNTPTLVVAAELFPRRVRYA